MDARIIEITPPGGPLGIRIWQLQVLHTGGPPHQSREGDHTSTQPEVLRMVAASQGLRLIRDDSL